MTYDTERNAAEFAAMFGGGGTRDQDQAAPSEAPAAPPAPRSRIVRTEYEPHYDGQTTAEQFADLAARVFRPRL